MNYCHVRNTLGMLSHRLEEVESNETSNRLLTESWWDKHIESRYSHYKLRERYCDA